MLFRLYLFGSLIFIHCSDTSDYYVGYMENNGVMTVRNTEIVQAWAQWYSNEPNDAWADCVVIWGLNPTTWFDEYCDEYYYAVCSNYSPYLGMYETLCSLIRHYRQTCL